jgi:ArsR family transcriptional regulator
MTPEMLFKALSDPTRLRCVVLLMGNSELCVCELTHALGLPQPQVSHHLGALRKAGLVSDRKDGLWIYYQINPDLPGWVGDVLRATALGMNEQVPFFSDQAALAGMPNRPGGVCSA